METGNHFKNGTGRGKRISKILCSVMMAMAIMSFVSCEKDEELTKDVHDLIPDKILETAKELGLEIHGGKNPPNIEGSYFASPVILVSTTSDNDYASPGDSFNDGNFMFSEQNNIDLTVLSYIEEISYGSDSGVGSLITGKGQEFTVFIRIMEMYSEITYFFVSGKIENGRIRSFQFLLLNENFQGRLFSKAKPLLKTQNYGIFFRKLNKQLTNNSMLFSCSC
jgi:hypothetical protein